ncbi:MAG TPA: hypothetical protein VMM93_08175 [Vicinamibacterales bacterium]|nr:hypothetical protein [Vicinamibacterales bacterium]
MIDYAFPAELAEQVVSRWRTFVSRHDSPAPPLPPPAALQHVLETAFFASFVREEGRDLRFVLCCATELDVRRDGAAEVVAVMPLVTPRPLSIESIRALAPAVSSDNAALLVRFSEDGGMPEIAGILHVGADLARARRGRSFYHRPAPYALIVDVRDVGELHVYRGNIKLASMRAGRLHDQIAFSSLELLPVSDILASGEKVLRPRIIAPADEPAGDTSDFEWTALLNTILCIVNGVRELKHGGTILLVSPGAEGSLPIRPKFRLDERADLLAEQFVQFINTRHALVAERSRRERHGARLDDAPLVPWETATFAAEDELADAADVVATLSAVDGAVVLRADLHVVCFGAEIVLDAALPLKAYEATGGVRKSSDLPVVDSESFGMRHRSAIRCVAASERTAAFVVSQDGSVTFCWKQGERVLLKRDVNTANPNMVGA